VGCATCSSIEPRSTHQANHCNPSAVFRLLSGILVARQLDGEYTFTLGRHLLKPVPTWPDLGIRSDENKPDDDLMGWTADRKARLTVELLMPYAVRTVPDYDSPPRAFSKRLRWDDRLIDAAICVLGTYWAGLYARLAQDVGRRCSRILQRNRNRVSRSLLRGFRVAMTWLVGDWG